MNNLTEASLSRVWQHFKSDRAVVIFTAFRDEVPFKMNIKTNKKFASVLKKNGFGYFFVDGHFPKNEGTNDEIDVKEDSIFAIAEKEDEKKLIALCHKLANSANQDSIIVKESNGDVYFLQSNGKKDKLSKGLSVGKIGKYYTKLRNKKVTNTFIFENVVYGKGFFQSFREFYTNN